MTCLAPLALIGVLLLILPIVVHLFKPRKMKETPFSSLRWLKATHQRLSRRIEWHQWLLFLMRAGCILLLVIALAKPLIGFWGGKPVERLVIVDTSRTMAYQTPDAKSPLERATELASRMVETARVGDHTAVILAGAPPRLVTPPSTDASSSLATLKVQKASLADGNLSATLPLIRSLLPRQKDREIELVFLTDNLQNRWQQKDVQSFLADLPNPVQVKVIDTGPGAAANAWIAGARFLAFGDDEDRWLRVDVACNRDSNLARSVRLTGIAGLADETQAVTLKPGTLSRLEFRIPAKTELRGQVAELRLEPADALSSDDVFFVNLDRSLALRVLIIEPETLGSDGRNVGLHLQTAMQSLTGSKNQVLAVTTRPSDAVTASDLQKADVVVLAGAADLGDAALTGLETRVRGGAGLAVFLGPELKAGFVNQKLHRAQQPAEGFLPFALKQPDWQIEGKPAALANTRWTHPLLAGVQDPVLSDFTQARFHRYAHLTGAPGRTDVILARFEDDVPAIVEHPLGAGRVLIFNTSANDEWSDLPRRKSFLPLVDKLLTHLSAGGVKRSYTAGEAVTIPLAEVQATSAVSVVAPSGTKLSPRVLVQRGQTLLHLQEVSEAGAYRVTGAGEKEIVFVVNASRSDSALVAMDVKTLEEWWAPANVEFISADSAAQMFGQQASHWPLWPMLVLFAGMLLVAETIYVHRLCPRANPKAADAVVREGGMMKPVSEPEA